MSKQPSTNKRSTKPLDWKEAKKALLLLESEERYHDLLILAGGFYTGYRIGDMLELKYKDLTLPPTNAGVYWLQMINEQKQELFIKVIKR